MGAMRGLSIGPRRGDRRGEAFIAIRFLSTTDYGVGDEVIYPNRVSIYGRRSSRTALVPVPLHLREARNFAFDRPSWVEDHEETSSVSSTRPEPTGGILGRRTRGDRAILRRHPDVWIYAARSTRGCATKASSARSRPCPAGRAHHHLDGASKTWAMTAGVGFA